MRTRFFRGLLGILERRNPRWVIPIQIQILLCVTARAFGRKGTAVWFRTPRKALEIYGTFTMECMRGNTDRPEQIYREAFKLGKRIRQMTGLKEKEDLERLVFYLYRGIGIEMNGQLPGEIEVKSCYFSGIYTPRACALMSSMDAGVIAGICGGGKLVFTERITQGDGRCFACFSKNYI